MKKLLGNLASCAAVLALIVSSFPAPALAQQTAKVVSSCGSVTYTAGGVNYVTMDLNGLACGSGGGGGGGVVTQSTPGNLQTLSNGSVTTSAPTYTTGTNQPLSLDTAGNLRVTGGSGGGASVTQRASVASVTAGTGQPLYGDSASGAVLFEPVVPGSTTTIDLSAPSGVLGVNGTTIATNANPFPTNVAQVAGAAPGLTNPIWIANAEAADITGTFTNGTQTTSITNTNADGYAGGLISINGTYGTASGVFEASDDAGTTFYSVICARSDGSAQETGYTSLTNTNRQWSCPVGGNDSFRVRSTAVASGTVNVRVGVSAPPPEALGGSGGGGIVTQATASNLNAQVVGNIASLSADSGNPVKVGCVYSTSGNISTITVGNRADCQADPFGSVRSRITTLLASGADGFSNTNGIGMVTSANNSTSTGLLGIAPYVFDAAGNYDRQRGDITGTATQPYGIPAQRWSYPAASGGIVNTTTAVTIKAAAGGVLKNCIASLDIVTDTLGAATELAVRDGAGGTVLYRTKLATTALIGRSIDFPAAICGTANTLMEVVTLTASITGAVYVNATGNVSP